MQDIIIGKYIIQHYGKYDCSYYWGRHMWCNHVVINTETQESKVMRGDDIWELLATDDLYHEHFRRYAHQCGPENKKLYKKQLEEKVNNTETEINKLHAELEKYKLELNNL